MSPLSSKAGGVTERCRCVSRLLPSLHLLALSSLAFAQPILDLLRRQPEFFVARGLEGFLIALLLVALLVVVPLPILLVDAAATLAGRIAQRWVHRILVAALVILIVLPFVRRLPIVGAGVWALLLAAATAISLTWAFEKLVPARLFLDYLSVAPLIVVGLFLGNPQIAGLLFAGSPDASTTTRSGGAGGAGGAGESRIVVLVLDELAVSGLLSAPGQINRHRYPHLARLASESTWFENAMAASPSTVWSVSAMLTGKFPEPAKLATRRYHPTNLFTYFGGDHEIWAHEFLTRLCPGDLNRRFEEPGSRSERDLRLLFSDLRVVYGHLVLPASLADRLPTVTTGWQGFARRQAPQARLRKARRVQHHTGVDDYRRFLDSLGADSDRSLHFMHLMMPHRPWVFLPSGREYRDDPLRMPGMPTAAEWGQEAWHITQAYRRYLLQLQYTDRLVGELVARLESLGTYDETLLVVVSDHGVSFRPGDRRRDLTLSNAPDILPTLMVVKRPGQRQGVVHTKVMSGVDLFPTIVGALDMPVPDGLDGRSALDPGFEAAPRQTFFLAKRRAEPGLVSRRFEERPRFAIHEYGEDLFTRKYETLEWKLATFGDGSDPLDIYRPGIRPELHGRSPDELQISSAVDVTVFLDDGERLRQLDPSSPVSHSRILGTIRHPGSELSCSDVAVAVNGRIEATTRTFYRGERCERFSVLVPEPSLQPGENRVEVFLIDGTSGALVLRRPDEDRAGYRVLLATDGDVDGVLIDGSRLSIVEDARFRSELSFFDDAGDSFAIGGWVIDRSRRTLPVTILLYRGDRLVAKAPVPKSARRRRQFHLRVQKSELAGIRLPELHVIALSLEEEIAWEVSVDSAFRAYRQRLDTAESGD